MQHRETHGTSLCFSAGFFLSAAIEGFLSTSTIQTQIQLLASAIWYTLLPCSSDACIQGFKTSIAGCKTFTQCRNAQFAFPTVTPAELKFLDPAILTEQGPTAIWPNTVPAAELILEHMAKFNETSQELQFCDCRHCHMMRRISSAASSIHKTQVLFSTLLTTSTRTSADLISAQSVRHTQGSAQAGQQQGSQKQ